MSVSGFFSSTWRDARYAARVLLRAPEFTITAVVTLALVIGANTAVFGLVDEILIKPLPYPEPERLARVDVVGRTVLGEGIVDRHDGTTWEHLRDNAAAVDVAITRGDAGSARDVNLSVNGVVSLVGQERVSAGFFRVLGVQPMLGREFTTDEDRPGGPTVVVLSYELWQRVFNGDPSAIGQTLTLRGEPYQVVGVMPQSFRSLTRGIDVWTPVQPARDGEGAGTNYGIIARVAESFAIEQASASLPPLDADYFRRLMGSGWAEAEPTGRFSLVPLEQAATETATAPLLTLSAAAGAVLLIACLNLAALFAVRAGGRARELATRVALGSSRPDLVRQLFTECLLLGVTGAAAGLFIGWLGLESLQNLGASTYPEWQAAIIDWRALGVTTVLGLTASIGFGLLPAIAAGRQDVRSSLSDGDGRTVAGSRRSWPGKLLVSGEIAAGVVLLVVAGLLTQTFVKLSNLAPGFDASGVVTARVSLQDARYEGAAAMNDLFTESLRRLESSPFVESAAVSLGLPYERLLNLNFAFADEAEPTGPRIANFAYATPSLFDTLRIPIVRGRAITDADSESSPSVVVVNQEFVDLVVGGANPIGRRIRVSGRDREIVGVTGNVRLTESGFFIPGMVQGPIQTAPLVYMPAAQVPDAFMAFHTWYSPTWTVRARDAAAAENALRAAIIGADPLLPVIGPRPMAAVQAEATSEQRLLMVLVGILAIAALLLAGVGLYGVIAHSVSERKRELRIRMALGATVGQTVRGVALPGIGFAAIGAIVGLGVAWVVAGALDARALLWGVDSRNPLMFAAVALFLMLIAVIASVVPALRISRLDTSRTLRA